MRDSSSIGLSGARFRPMSLYRLKPAFQALLRPLVAWLFRLGVSANQVTVVATIVSLLLGAGLVAAAVAGAWHWFLLLPPWCLLRMALNAVDGLLAREFGQRSTLGVYLNELGDLLADAALYLPFAFVDAACLWTVLLVIFLAGLSEVAGILGATVGGERRNEGPMGKSDRALVFGGLGVLLGAGLLSPTVLLAVLIAVALLLGWTLINRVKRGIIA